VSGGGPYTLALLASYLELCDTNGGPPAKIQAISVVAGICCSAGVDDMMPANQNLYNVVSKCQTSWWSRTNLHLMFAASSAFAKLLPTWLMLKMMSMSEIPSVDCAILSNKITGGFMVGIFRDALRQGGSGAELEAAVLFRSHPSFEETLKKQYKPNMSSSDGVSSLLPKITIYQGMLDKNVPPSHSQYVHDKLLGQSSTLVTFDDLGHVSLVTEKAADYARFAVSK
jgi:hypothetical protein